jgi:hypothetical protein
MANPEEPLRQDGGPPRRPPPTIDMEAVEVPPPGAPAASNKLPGWRLLVIGAIGVVAVIAAGAYWIYLTPTPPDVRQVDVQHPDAARDAAKLDDLTGRIARLEAAASAPPAQATVDPSLANRVAALESAVRPLAERVAELERHAKENAAAARGAGERADTVAGLVDELKKGSADQNSLAERERSTLEGLTGRLKALEALESTLKSRQEEFETTARTPPAAAPDMAVRVAVIAAALRAAVERDIPFTAELAAARTLGLDEKALAALAPFAATGVPTQNELFRELSALVPELLRVSAPAGHDGGYLDRLQASATKMMNIRPVGDVPGDDPSTVIGRIEMKMVRQDVVGAVAELDKLPAPAKELAQPWRQKALARQAAIDSARRIAAASFTKLAEPAAQSSPR